MTYGLEFLEKLQRYYGSRLREAQRRGLGDAAAPYHWLYRELEVRVELLAQVKLFLGLVRQYLLYSNVEQTLTFAVEYVVVWFDEKNIGRMPQSVQGGSVYFARENPYWLDIQAAGEKIGRRETGQNSALCAPCICEYVVCCLRLYFYIREKQFRSIDREHFTRLMEPVPHGDYVR